MYQKKIYLPTIYVDENGEVWNSKRLQEYEYRKGEQEQHESRDQFGTIRESRQSEESTRFRDALLRGDSSTERPVEQMEYEGVEGSPFSIVGSEQKGYTIVIGTYCVKKEKFKTMQEAKDYIESKPWDLIFIGVNIYRDQVKKHLKEPKKKK